MVPFSGFPQTTNCPPAPYPMFRGQTASDDPGPSGSKPTSEADGHTDDDPEDVVEMLDPSEALELVEFDPSVDPKDAWKPPKAISAS